jgi:hypothetical protein
MLSFLWRAETTAIPDMALRLRCSECGSRNIKMMLNVREMYATAHGVAPPSRHTRKVPETGE